MIYTLITACLTAADLVTKALARRDRRIRKIYNPGFSFGHLKEHPFIVKGIPTVVGILSAVKWVQAVALPGGTDGHQRIGGADKTVTEDAITVPEDDISTTFKKIAYSMILAGAIGNTYERVKQGYVTDFINIPKGRIRTWFFNIADLCVAAGAALMILGELTEKQ
jgi:lipoprotein signal peptidase